MKKSYREAFTEVDEILNYVPKDYIEKIPIKLRNFIKENKSEDYKFSINERYPIEEQILKYETKSFIAILLLKYWDKENYEKLLKIYNNNECRFQKKLQEKYNTDIFKKENNINNENEKNIIVEYKKENIFIKFFRKILRKIKIFK